MRAARARDDGTVFLLGTGPGQRFTTVLEPPRSSHARSWGFRPFEDRGLDDLRLCALARRTRPLLARQPLRSAKALTTFAQSSRSYPSSARRPQGKQVLLELADHELRQSAQLLHPLSERRPARGHRLVEHTFFWPAPGVTVPAVRAVLFVSCTRGMAHAAVLELATCRPASSRDPARQMPGGHGSARGRQSQPLPLARRPQAEHELGRGKARAGSARSARKAGHDVCRRPRCAQRARLSTRARAEQAGGGHQDDQSTRQPVEGDVVDSDPDFSELCSRMRETGKTSCTILFCESDVFIEAETGGRAEPGLGFSGRSA